MPTLTPVEVARMVIKQQPALVRESAHALIMLGVTELVLQVVENSPPLRRAAAMLAGESSAAGG